MRGRAYSTSMRRMSEKSFGQIELEASRVRGSRSWGEGDPTRVPSPRTEDRTGDRTPPRRAPPQPPAHDTHAQTLRHAFTRASTPHTAPRGAHSPRVSTAVERPSAVAISHAAARCTATESFFADYLQPWAFMTATLSAVLALFNWDLYRGQKPAKAVGPAAEEVEAIPAAAEGVPR